MLFSIIYSVDTPSNIDVLAYAPPEVETLWDKTEDDFEYGYGYLEGVWQKGHHRKWCGILDREQFDDFVHHCNLIAESTETLGSIGAPGFGFGWSPAICFSGDEEDAIKSCYVTPLPEVEKKHSDEHDWDRVRGAVLAVYG